eukprot:617183-Prorocentrum_lima.AAC.1
MDAPHWFLAMQSAYPSSGRSLAVSSRHSSAGWGGVAAGRQLGSRLLLWDVIVTVTTSCSCACA